MKKRMEKYNSYIFTLGVLFLLILSYILRNRAIEEEKIKKEIEKYNEYANFYNKMPEEVLRDFQIYYLNNFSDKNKNFKKPETINLIEMNLMRQKLNSIEKNIEEMEIALSEEPEFKNIDKYIKEHVEAIKAEKRLALNILEYYEKGMYKEDSFDGGIFFHAMYINLTRENSEKYSIYVNIMKELIKKEKEKEIKRLEKKKKTAAINMVLFIEKTEEFLKEVTLKEGSAYNKVKKIKVKREEMKIQYEKLKNVADNQIKKEKYSLDDYNEVRRYSKELMDISDEIIKKMEDGKDIFPVFYEFGKKYNQVINSYNVMIRNKKLENNGRGMLK